MKQSLFNACHHKVILFYLKAPSRLYHIITEGPQTKLPIGMLSAGIESTCWYDPIIVWNVKNYYYFILLRPDIRLDIGIRILGQSEICQHSLNQISGLELRPNIRCKTKAYSFCCWNSIILWKEDGFRINLTEVKLRSNSDPDPGTGSTESGS